MTPPAHPPPTIVDLLSMPEAASVEFAQGVDAAHIAERLAALAILADEWAPKGAPRPEGLDYLEGVEEFNAVALSAGHDDEVIAPAMAFVALPAWLQRWVLERWGLADLIGRRLGTPD